MVNIIFVRIVARNKIFKTFDSCRIRSRGRVNQKLFCVISVLLLLVLTLKLFLLCPQLDPIPHHSTYVWTNEHACTHRPSQPASAGEILKDVVIIVNSARHNFMERKLIRETWGSISRVQNWTILGPFFMIGESAPGEPANISTSLDFEHEIFGDFVKGNFMDTYRNLTLKTIMAHQWLVQFCPTAHVVVKTDDDSIVNVFELIKNLNKIPNMDSSSTIYCPYLIDVVPQRNTSSKWFMTFQEYPDQTFPPYCAGAGIIMSMKVVQKIVYAFNSYRGRLVWIDDVFMSGTIPQVFNSMANKVSGSFNFDRENISHIDKGWLWFYCPDIGEGHVKYLTRWLSLSSSEPIGDEKINKYNTFVFYVVQRGSDWLETAIKVWEKIVHINTEFVEEIKGTLVN